MSRFFRVVQWFEDVLIGQSEVGEEKYDHRHHANQVGNDQYNDATRFVFSIFDLETDEMINVDDIENTWDDAIVYTEFGEWVL